MLRARLPRRVGGVTATALAVAWLLLCSAAAAGQIDASWSAVNTWSDGSFLDPSTVTYRVYWQLFPQTPCPGTQFIVTNPGQTTAHLGSVTQGMSYNVQATAVVGSLESGCSLVATGVARADAAPVLTPGSNLRIVFAAQGPPPTTVTLGETTIGSVTKGSLGGALIAQPITLATAVRLLSLALNVASPAGGRATLGLYTDLNGHPNSLVAGLPSQGLVAGWNTVTLAAPVSLTPGTFWLVASFDSNGTTIPITGSPMPFGFGFTLPATFPPIQGTIAGHAAFTATVGP